MHCDAHSAWRHTAQAFIHILRDLLEPICDYMVILLGDLVHGLYLTFVQMGVASR